MRPSGASLLTTLHYTTLVYIYLMNIDGRERGVHTIHTQIFYKKSHHTSAPPAPPAAQAHTASELGVGPPLRLGLGGWRLACALAAWVAGLAFQPSFTLH